MEGRWEDQESDKEETDRETSCRIIRQVLETPDILSLIEQRLPTIGFDETENFRTDLEEILRFQEAGIPLDEYRQKLLNTISAPSLKGIQQEERVSKAEKKLPIALVLIAISMLIFSSAEEETESYYNKTLMFSLIALVIYTSLKITGHNLKTAIRKTWEEEFQY